MLLLAALIGLFLLSGCTRNRPPWPTITPLATAPGTPASEDAGAQATDAPAKTPVPPPAETPGTPAAAETSTPDPGGGLPPLPGNEELTPLPPTATPTFEIFSYKVQPGDSLYSIARDYGTTYETLVDINELDDPNALSVGQIINVPGEAPPGVPLEEGVVHVVEAGETLFRISQKYGVPLDQLAEANQITNPNTLRTGQRLIIPSGGSQTPSTGRRVHVIQPGDTVTSIAAQYGVTPAAIIQANELTDPNRLTVGKQLIIP